MGTLLKGKERLLLIDTCGETSGVALSIGTHVLATEDLARGKVSAEIVSAVRRLLEQAGWRLSDLDAVGVVNGPGSFTGIRAGLAMAKGLCVAGGLPLTAVSRLEVLADAASLKDGFVALDAGRSEVYVREESIGREWLCSNDSLIAIAKENQTSSTPASKKRSRSLGARSVGSRKIKHTRVVIAEEWLVERFEGCEPELYQLQVRDALGAVLRRLYSGVSDVSLVDANYVRDENYIYRRPEEIATPDRTEA